MLGVNEVIDDMPRTEFALCLSTGLRVVRARCTIVCMPITSRLLLVWTLRLVKLLLHRLKLVPPTSRLMGCLGLDRCRLMCW